MITAVSAAFEALIDFFSNIFTLMTSSVVVPWIVFGIAISVVGICIKFFKKIVWGL
jgi:hypothetical protein